MPPLWRWAPAAILFTSGTAFVVLAVSTRGDEERLAIWVGLASSALTAALVDASALLEARRRLRALPAVALRRYRRAAQELDQLAMALFETSDAAQLRALVLPLAVDLSGRAKVFPSRSRREYASELIRSLDDAVDVMLGFAAAGVMAAEIAELDRFVHHTEAMSAARAFVVVDGPHTVQSSTLLPEWATLLDRSHQVMARRP